MRGHYYATLYENLNSSVSSGTGTMENLAQILDASFMHKPLWMWVLFVSIILFLLFLDLGLFNREDKEIGFKKSLVLSVFYIGIGLLFSVWVGYFLGKDRAFEYLTGFVLEKSLAMDNIFVMAMMFSYFAIPRIYQHRVLFWGIIGAIVLRGIMICIGATLVSRFEWILYIFAAFLVYSGIKMFLNRKEEESLVDNPIILFMEKNFRITREFHGHHFFAHSDSNGTKSKRLYATPLLLALVCIEVADIIFAVDSIPAIFTITKDAYVVFTSNIFAILGLRALYFVLAAAMSRFRYLKYALSFVLVFIGAKILVIEFFDITKVPPLFSLVVTLAILTTGILFSLKKTKEPQKTG